MDGDITGEWPNFSGKTSDGVEHFDGSVRVPGQIDGQVVLTDSLDEGDETTGGIENSSEDEEP